MLRKFLSGFVSHVSVMKMREACVLTIEFSRNFSL